MLKSRRLPYLVGKASGVTLVPRATSALLSHATGVTVRWQHLGTLGYLLVIVFLANINVDGAVSTGTSNLTVSKWFLSTLSIT